MSSLQTRRNHEDHRHPPASLAKRPEGVFASSLKIVWDRRDWDCCVGSFHELELGLRESSVDGASVRWTRFRIPELLLSRKAAMLVLQGMALPQLLIPNHFLHPADNFFDRKECAHLLLRADPWEPWHSRPRLAGLVLARLDSVPDGLDPQAVLAALARDSA